MMTTSEKSAPSSNTLRVFGGVLALAGLYASSLYSYLLFHSLVENFNVLVAFLIFVLAWHTRHVQDNRYLMFVGVASLFTGSLDLLHTLAYKGSVVFPGYTADLPTQLWIAFRYVAGLSFVAAPFFINRKINAAKMISAYFAITAILVIAIFSRHFPACFVEGAGLTPFKVSSEYVISLLFLAALGLLLWKREAFDRRVLRFLTGAILASVASELFFTHYVSVYGPANMIGHFFLLVATVFIYRAFVVTGIVEPSSLLFRNLNQSREALRESERRERARAAELAALLDAAPTPVFIAHDPDCLHLTGNRAADELLRNPRGAEASLTAPEESRPRHFRAFKDGRELRMDELPAQRAARGNPVQDFEFSLVFENGMTRHVVGYATPLRDEEGRPRGAVHVLIDITDRKRAEEKLRQSEATLRGILDAAHESIWLFSTEGIILLCNDTALQRLGKKTQDVIGKHFSNFMSPDIAQARVDILRQVVSTERSVEYEDTRNGIMFHHNFYPIFDQDGHVVRVACFSHDITARKQAEETLKTAHTELANRAYELEAVNRELEAFSYTVSHDLKTPLRSIDGFTRAILEDYSDKLDSAGRDYLKRVNAATLRMNQLIDAMLNMARLTRGELHERTVDLSSLVQIVAHDLEKQDPERRVEFVIAENLKVTGDATMLELLLQNLIENAWKFTRKHEAAKIEFGAVDMNGTKVHYVRDDGAGFDMQFADKLFMPFKRLHAEAEFPGLGIGLAIAHRIILRHNGRIWAEGEVGKGAVFYFTL